MTKKKRSLKKGEKRDGAGRPRDYAKEYERRKKKYPDYSKRWNIGAKKQAVKQKPKRPTQKRSADKRVTIKQNERKIEQLKQQQFDLQKSIEDTEKRIVEQKANYAKFRNYLTDKEKYVVRYLYESGKTRKEISEIMHRSLDAISKYIKKMLSEEEVEVQQGEPDYESVKSRPENVEKDGAMDLSKTEEKKESSTKKEEVGFKSKESANYYFEKKFGRQIDWDKLEDRREYNRIYAKLRYVADTKARQTEKTDSATKKKRDETDAMRRDRLCTCHMQGKDASGQELKRKVDHDELGECPYCFPNSKWSIATDEKGYTKYDRMLMHRNLLAKEWALMHKPNAIPTPKGEKFERYHPIKHTDDCVCEKCEEKRAEIERLNQPDTENPRFTLGGKMIPRADRPEIPKPEDMKLQDKLQDAGIDIEQPDPEPSEPQDVVKPTSEDFKEIEKLNKELVRHQHQQDASALRARNLKEKLDALKKKAGEGGKK